MKLEVNTIPVTDGSKIYELTFIRNQNSSRTLKLTEESFKALENYFKPKKQKKVKQPAPPPTIEEVKAYFKSEGYQEDAAIRFFKYYEALDWFDGNGKPVLRWKGKAISSWFKPEAKLKVETKNKSSFFES